MLGRVTHTLDAAAMWVRSSFYLIHTLKLRQLFFDIEREYTMYHLPFGTYYMILSRFLGLFW